MAVGRSITTNSARYGSAARDNGTCGPSTFCPNIACRSTGRSRGRIPSHVSGTSGSAAIEASFAIRSLRSRAEAPWHSAKALER